MPPLALGLVLGAAVLHAGWNVLVARSRDTEIATALTIAVSVVVSTPFALLGWSVQAEAWPYVVASSVLELAYIVLLAAAYRRADLSLVYPVARGLAPVLVLAGGIALLGLTPTSGQALGVLLVTAGLLLVRGLQGDMSGPLRDVALAVLIAAIISAYTLIDREGVRYVSPVTYFWLVLVGPGIVYLVWLWRRRGGAALRAALGPPIVVAGVANFAAFTMVLTALTLALPAAVSAVRESSVVVATVLAALVLGESVDRARIAGSVVVVVGVALVALG